MLPISNLSCSQFQIFLQVQHPPLTDQTTIPASSSTMDPLSALRDFTIRNDLDKILRYGDDFRFGNSYTFPCKTETAYRSKQGNLYTLESLVFFIQNRHLKQSLYMKTAINQGIPTVTLIDRKPLLDYLEGRSSNSDAIEFVLPTNDVEEYRPEDPQFLTLRSNSNAAPPAVEFNHENENSEPRVSDNVDLMDLIRCCERPLRDRNAILQCRNRDFYGIYVGALRREQEKQRVEPQQRKDGPVGPKGRPITGDKDDAFHSGPKAKMLKGGKVGEGVPIILVPSASNTLITIYNVKEFLEDGVFIPTDVKMKQMKGPKPECVTVQKKFSRDKDKIMTAYEVRDKPSTLKADDWDRVVAVFVLGKEWQFKDWPFKDHVEIFNKVIGFFMRFEDDSIESAKVVKQWNVKIISISKNKRHQDRAAALEVWGKLEEFVARSRS